MEILGIGSDVTALREAEREKEALEAHLQRAERMEAISDEGRGVVLTRRARLQEGIKGYEMIEAGEYTVLRVSDTGVGISPRDLEKIFEPF